jgi:hypothetical protein
MPGDPRRRGGRLRPPEVAGCGLAAGDEAPGAPERAGPAAAAAGRASRGPGSADPWLRLSTGTARLSCWAKPPAWLPLGVTELTTTPQIFAQPVCVSSCSTRRCGAGRVQLSPRSSCRGGLTND